MSMAKLIDWNENCKDNIVPKERDFNANELNIIQQALISKFYEVLDTILDLDQNVILKAFKNIAHIVRKNPPSSRDIILDTKVSINLKTISINPSELSNKKYGLTQNCINYINAILQRNLYYTSFYDVIKNQNEEKTIIFGVAMKSGSRLVISYIIGNAVVDTYHFVCPLFSPIFREKMNIVPKRRYPAYYQSRCEAYNKGKDFRKLKEDYVNSLGNSEENKNNLSKLKLTQNALKHYQEDIDTINEDIENIKNEKERVDNKIKKLKALEKNELNEDDKNKLKDIKISLDQLKKETSKFDSEVSILNAALINYNKEEISYLVNDKIGFSNSNEDNINEEVFSKDEII